MGKIYQISKNSKTNIIKIKIGAEVLKFNLHNELVISEDKISQEAMEQPSVYGYLSLIQKKLFRRKEDKAAEVEKLKAKAYLRAKGEIDQYTRRPKSNEYAEYSAIADDEYQDGLKELSLIREQVGVITSCIKSFEQRASLIQTISANYRKEIL